MKAKLVQLLSVVLCLTVVLSAVCITRTELHAASSSPLMYYNDKAWPKSDTVPMEKIYSTLYVPVTLFAQLKNVTVKKNEGLNLFVIENGSYWLTFNVKTNFAYTQDSEPMYWRSAYYHGDYYVPVRSVCSYLHLNFEEMTSSVTGETAIRITDGSETKTFEELIRSKYPDFFPPETTESRTEPITAPITTPETTTSASISETTAPLPQLGERIIYITIEDSPSAYTKEILDVLAEFGYSATFFLIGNQLSHYADTVSRIAANGHAIGLHTMAHSSYALTNKDAILADIEEENLLLSRIIKQKSHIWRAPEGSSKLSSLTSEARLTLSQKGYSIWDFNVSIPSSLRADKAAEVAINGIWENDVAILRFVEGSYTATALRTVLTFIEENRDVCEVRVISPAYYEYSNVG